MNRLWLGIGLMVALLAMGIWVGSYMNTTGNTISTVLDSAAETALSGDLQTATQLVENAKAEWDGIWHWVAAIADHAPMDEIDSLFALLEKYADAGLTGEFAAHCSRIAQLISAVGEAHSFNWWNLL